MLTGTQSNLSKLRVFESRVCACIPGASRFPKLDQKNAKRIFLGFAATDNNIYFEHDNSGQILISTHVIIDEAHLNVPSSHTSLGAQSLQSSGYNPEDNVSVTR